MTALRCSLQLLLLLIWPLLLLGLAGGAQLGPSHSLHPFHPCSLVHSRLGDQQLQRHWRPDCTDSTDHRRSSANSPYIAAYEPLRKPAPTNITPDASWEPGLALTVYVQDGYWYVAWEQGVDNYQAHTILKVDGSSHQPISNVTLNSTYTILTIVGNSSHIFVQVGTGDGGTTLVLTFNAGSMQLVGEVTLSVTMLLSGVNAAGTLFTVVVRETQIAAVLNACTGVRVAALDGGVGGISPWAAAYDDSTDTVIVYDESNYESIYGIALNNTLLWTIKAPYDNIRAIAIAVDPQGHYLYVFAVVYTEYQPFLGYRLIQYDLVTHMEIGRYDLFNQTVYPRWQISAGPVDGSVYLASLVDGTVTQLSVQDGVQQSTSFSSYPYWLRLSSVASLDGASFTVFTVAPFELLTISADGEVQRRTAIAPVNACGEGVGPMNIDVDMHGNIVVPLCSLGVRVYSSDHTLLHIIRTVNNTVPTGVAVTASGEFVYVMYNVVYPNPALPLTQLYEVATGKLVANFTSPNNLTPTAIAVDPIDDSLWVMDYYHLYHWAMNTTLLAAFGCVLCPTQLAVDSQHRRLVVPVWGGDGIDQLDWFDMEDGALIQQFRYPTYSSFGVVAVTKDSALTIAVGQDNGVWYFFRNDIASSNAREGRQQRQQPVRAQVGFAAGASVPLTLTQPSDSNSLVHSRLLSQHKHRLYRQRRCANSTDYMPARLPWLVWAPPGPSTSQLRPTSLPMPAGCPAKQWRCTCRTATGMWHGARAWSATGHTPS